MNDIQFCTSSGVGMYHLNGEVYERLLEEVDLAFQVSLPNRKELKPKVRKLVGSAYDLFEKGEWRQGFLEAAQALEEESRKYLRRRVNNGKNQYKDGRKTKSVTLSEVNKMTLGGVKNVVCNLVIQTTLDSRLCAGITKLNPTRIARVHKPTSRATERRMRDRVGRDMWMIVNLLREMIT